MVEIDKKLNSIVADVLFIALKKRYENIILCTKEIQEESFMIEIKLLDNKQAISINDFQDIEKLMKKIIGGAHKVNYELIKKPQLLEKFSSNNYLLHWINEYKDNQTLYLANINDFTFIEESNEVLNVNKIKAFKLLSIGGSYWLSDAKNEQLIRIQGVGFDNKIDFDEYIKQYNEQIEYDHRTIGKNQELFTFDLLAGQGLPFWLPNGAIIKKEIRNFLSSLEFKYGFDSVYSPILGSIDLYKKSGHWEHYQENMFAPIDVDNEQLILRPMTCPHHILIFKKKNYSYKQLPIRLCEESMLHRYESSGGLTGFERVREMVLEDTHIFCTPEQIKDEVLNCYHIIKEAYAGLGCETFQVDLSLHDPENKEKFHHDEKMWTQSENDLRTILKENNIPFVEKVGEAAFYGPKIDFQVKTSLGRIITMSTIQLDFLLPQKFELTYKDENNQLQDVIMIHLGIVGTYERLLSILLEQTKGLLPLWLCPKQVVIIPINNDIHNEFANKINDLLRTNFIRSYVDNRQERLNKKIRDAQINKINYQIIVGDDEMNNEFITYRKYGSENTHKIEINDFINLIKLQIFDKK